MEILTTKAELRAALAARSGRRGVVPTMGFLHTGHTTLFDQARVACDTLVATIFVNPTQFGPNEDLDRYPRDPEGDAAKCRAHGVDLLWMPTPSEVYAADHTTTVHVASLTDGLCGPVRPGHFDGVATVVAKIFGVIRPDIAHFGEKDFQQLAVIRRMVRDLDLGIEVVGVPTIREPDGLAMSSRNVYLKPEQRSAALGLSRALCACRAAYAAGNRTGRLLLATLRQTMEATDGLRTQYAELVDPDALTPIPAGDVSSTQGIRAILAGYVGNTRLIDNAAIDHHDPSFPAEG